MEERREEEPGDDEEDHAAVKGIGTREDPGGVIGQRVDRGTRDDRLVTTLVHRFDDGPWRPGG